MTQQIKLDAAARADAPAAGEDSTREVLSDVAYKRMSIVNIAMIGLPGHSPWVLIDTSLPGNAAAIRNAGQLRFNSRRPEAIILTHGHVDHSGSLQDLLDEWDVPVFAHSLEAPYLDGRSAYPPPDPTVGGGVMPLLSPLFPRAPIDVAPWLHILPADGTIPCLADWRWIHTPGHSPGHISLWRESDRTLIVGDAFITTNQESAYAVATQAVEMHGPPKYFTPDFESARESVRLLAELEPEVVITGHGRAMQGPKMRAALHELAERFDEVAVPKNGRYVLHPERAEDGSAYH